MSTAWRVTQRGKKNDKKPQQIKAHMRNEL